MLVREKAGLGAQQIQYKSNSLSVPQFPKRQRQQSLPSYKQLHEGEFEEKIMNEKCL